MTDKDNRTAEAQVPLLASGAIDHAAVDRQARQLRREALVEMASVSGQHIARAWVRLAEMTGITAIRLRYLPDKLLRLERRAGKC